MHCEDSPTVYCILYSTYSTSRQPHHPMDAGLKAPDTVPQQYSISRMEQPVKLATSIASIAIRIQYLTVRLLSKFPSSTNKTATPIRYSSRDSKVSITNISLLLSSHVTRHRGRMFTYSIPGTRDSPSSMDLHIYYSIVSSGCLDQHMGAIAY